MDYILFSYIKYDTFQSSKNIMKIIYISVGHNF